MYISIVYINATLYNLPQINVEKCRTIELLTNVSAIDRSPHVVSDRQQHFK